MAILMPVRGNLRSVIILILFCGLCGAAVEASATSVATRAEGVEHAYNLDFDEAQTTLRRAIVCDPTDSATYRQLAGVYWLDILFGRHTPTVDDLIDEVKTPERVPKPSLDLVSRFRESAERALALAEDSLRTSPRDAEAHFQVGASIGLRASYAASIDGHPLGAIRAARRAYEESRTALLLDPQRRDAGLTVGIYQYLVSTLPFPLRIVAHLVGFKADRPEATRLIEEAAAYPSENQTDAQLMLIVIHNRERRYDAALQIITALQARYPRNRLLWLEAGSTLLRAGRFADAERALDEGFAKLTHDTRRRAFGELAVWHYKRGAARVALKSVAEAESDLHAALNDDGEEWVRGRAHAELGKLAQLAGDPNRARQEYETAMRLARASGDPTGAAEAKRLLQPNSQ